MGAKFSVQNVRNNDTQEELLPQKGDGHVVFSRIRGDRAVDGSQREQANLGRRKASHRDELPDDPDSNCWLELKFEEIVFVSLVNNV